MAVEGTARATRTLWLDITEGRQLDPTSRDNLEKQLEQGYRVTSAVPIELKSTTTGVSLTLAPEQEARRSTVQLREVVVKNQHVQPGATTEVAAEQMKGVLPKFAIPLKRNGTTTWVLYILEKVPTGERK